MKKKLFGCVLLIAVLAVLCGCGHSHEWQEAACETPKICAGCQETEGEALGHNWVISCDKPETCAVCGEVRGEAPGHAWVEASCAEAKHCSVCGTTEGEAPGHDFETGRFVEFLRVDAEQNVSYNEMCLVWNCTVCGEEVTTVLSEGAQKWLISGEWKCIGMIKNSREAEVAQDQVFAEFNEDGTATIAANGKAYSGRWDTYGYTGKTDDTGTTNYQLGIDIKCSNDQTIRAYIDGTTANCMLIQFEDGGNGNVWYRLEWGREPSAQELLASETLPGKWELRVVQAPGAEACDAVQEGWSGTAEFTEDGTATLTAAYKGMEINENGTWLYTGFIEDPESGEEVFQFALNLHIQHSILMTFAQEPEFDGLIGEGPYFAITTYGVLLYFEPVSE